MTSLDKIEHTHHAAPASAVVPGRHLAIESRVDGLAWEAFQAQSLPTSS